MKVRWLKGTTLEDVSQRYYNMLLKARKKTHNKANKRKLRQIGAKYYD